MLKRFSGEFQDTKADGREAERERQKNSRQIHDNVQLNIHFAVWRRKKKFFLQYFSLENGFSLLVPSASLVLNVSVAIYISLAAFSLRRPTQEKSGGKKTNHHNVQIAIK